MRLHAEPHDVPERMIFNQQTTATGARLRFWFTYASNAGLVSVSTCILLLCPCDRPGGTAYSIFLISLSGLFALAAAAILYLRLRQDSGATAFITAFKAAGVAALAVYLELRLAVLIVEWLARIRR
jgi:hypothetical protein